MKKLETILEKVNVFNVINSYKVIDHMKKNIKSGLFLPKGHIMMTIDFENMYTNLPFEKAIHVISKEWEQCFPKPKDQEEKAVEKPYMGQQGAAQVIRFFVAKGGYFLAGGKLYKQTKGLMMGAALSTAIAAIYINDELKRME